MPTKTLTDRFVAGTRNRSTTRQNYFDTKVKGLTLRASPRSAKTWSFVYRFQGKPSQWLALGTYPAMGLAEARKAALERRHLIDVDGRDPIAEQRAADAAALQPAPAVFTFSDLVTLYLRFAKARKKTWRDDAQKIQKYLVPAWGTQPLRSIARAHVHELLDTLVAKGMTTGVNRVQAVISRMFTIALDRSLIDAHPATRMLKRQRERPRERVLTDDELRALWAGLDDISGMASDALRLRLLLGQRIGEELMPMRWDEVNLEVAVWVIPRERTKNQKQPHTVPLPPSALAILQRRRQEIPESEPRVFPGLTRFDDSYRALSELRTGYEWTDLRRTIATRLAALGFGETTIGRVLNHARYTVTARHYNQHAYDSEKRQALEAWDRELQRIVQHQQKAKAAVVSIGRRG